MNKVTFGIATRITHPDRKAYLHLCIDSILGQSDNHWEIIISDDNSTIDVGYDRYIDNPKITIYRQDAPLGIFKNFDYCLQKSRTKWFLPMGDDDIVHPNFVAEILAITEREESIDVVYFDHENIDSRGKVFKITPNKYKEGFVHDRKEGIADINSLLWNSPASFFSVVNTEKLKELGGYPNYGMTTDGYIAFLYFTYFCAYYIDKRIAQLRRHKNNASGARSIVPFMDERINLINAIMKDFGNKLNNESVQMLEKEKEVIKYGHIMTLKHFQEGGRWKGIRYGFECIQNGYASYKGFIILILGLVLGRHIHRGFNVISDIHQYTQVHMSLLKPN